MHAHIREMTVKDYDEAYSLWQQSEGVRIGPADARDEIARFLERNRGLSFVCIADNRIVGSVLCSHDGRRGYIYHLAIAEDQRKKGVGKALVTRALATLRKEGIPKCHLLVFSDNIIGQEFWTSLGWAKRDDIMVFSYDL